jgi:hypothetical protein
MHYAIFQMMRHAMHINVEAVFTRLHKEKTNEK